MENHVPLSTSRGKSYLGKSKINKEREAAERKQENTNE